MSARIEVIKGPDQGWKFTLVGGEARIGRGAGRQVRMTDPAWPDGDIRVQLKHGGYLVTNGLPHAVYLDGAPLAPDEARTLHHGATLQPTQATLLRLEIVTAPVGTGADAGVVAEAPNTNTGRSPLRRYAPTVAALLLACAGYFYLTQTAAAGLDLGTANRHKATLAEMETGSRCAPELRAVRLAISDAAYAETFTGRAAARLKYRDARDRLTALRGTTEKPNPALTADQLAKLAEVEEFVSQRLRATARR